MTRGKLQSAFSLACLLVLCLHDTGSGGTSWQWIDGKRVQTHLNEGSGLWLIDVRSAAEYESRHIEGSVNIPSAVLMHKKFSVKKLLVLVDDSLGQKSARDAAVLLGERGQERVFVLAGGLAAWKSEGLPMVGDEGAGRGVTAADLKWALGNSVPMNIYDLRSAKARKQGVLRSSEPVDGKTIEERVEKLKKALKRSERKNDLAARMQSTKPVVLVFAAADDAETHTKDILRSAKGDIRYLIGGYEATVSDELRQQMTTGACPTCPGGKAK